MTRDQQIRKALELLAPPPGQRRECRHDIGVALDRVEHRTATARSFRVARSKKGKEGVRRYYTSLRRLRDAYRSLDPAIRPWFSLAETAYIAGKPTVIDREIAIAEAFLDRPSRPPRRDASRHKAAVAALGHAELFEPVCNLLHRRPPTDLILSRSGQAGPKSITYVNIYCSAFKKGGVFGQGHAWQTTTRKSEPRCDIQRAQPGHFVTVLSATLSAQTIKRVH